MFVPASERYRRSVTAARWLSAGFVSLRSHTSQGANGGTGVPPFERSLLRDYHGLGNDGGLGRREPPGKQSALVPAGPNRPLVFRPVKVGILTGGGDCPGLNAVIRAVARRSQLRGDEVVGVREGWRGLVEGLFEPLGPREISGLLPRGGTILGTSRTNPFKAEGGAEAVLKHFAAERLDALVAIGGEDTLGVAARLHREHDFPVVGVPKTIDNDLSAPTTRSASTPPSGSARRRSTGCTRPPSRTTASWSSR